MGGHVALIFTARANFQEEKIKNQRLCQACGAGLQGRTALVVRWKNRRKQNASLAVCDDKCWQDFDHAFWSDKATKREVKTKWATR